MSSKQVRIVLSISGIDRDLRKVFLTIVLLGLTCFDHRMVVLLKKVYEERNTKIVQRIEHKNKKNCTGNSWANVCNFVFSAQY